MHFQLVMVKLRSEVRCLMEGGTYSDLSVNDGALIRGLRLFETCCWLFTVFIYWPEAHLVLSQTSMMKLFAQIVNGWKSPSTAWKFSKYVVISGLYFPVFGQNTGKYGPEIISYLDTFHAVIFHRVLNTFLIVKRRTSSMLNTPLLGRT